MSAIIIDTATLDSWMHDGQPLIILDARARLQDANAGRALYLNAHIPGALHADMDQHLASRPTRLSGRHPLPSKQAWAKQLRQWGISPKHRVVVYDDTGARLAASRTWWMLRWAGLTQCFVLDGGWPAWQAADLPTLSGAASPVADPTENQWQPTFNNDLQVSTQVVAGGQLSLVDARAAERYRGEVEPMDAKAGHIPGAFNSPGSELLTDKLTFKPKAELDKALPKTDVAYCGSGVSACQLILVAAHLGRPLPKLYVGSWSAWSSDKALPIATDL